MTSILTRIAAMLGQVLKAILPEFIREWKKPQRTRVIGGDEELRSAVEDSIRDEASGGVPNDS